MAVDPRPNHYNAGTEHIRFSLTTVGGKGGKPEGCGGGGVNGPHDWLACFVSVEILGLLLQGCCKGSGADRLVCVLRVVLAVLRHLVLSQWGVLSLTSLAGLAGWLLFFFSWIFFLLYSLISAWMVRSCFCCLSCVLALLAFLFFSFVIFSFSDQDQWFNVHAWPGRLAGCD